MAAIYYIGTRRLIVLTTLPGWGDRPVPVPMFLGASGGPGSGWQGLAVEAGKAYNISVWARSSLATGMTLAIATGSYMAVP